MSAILRTLSSIACFPIVAPLRYHIFTGPNRRLCRRMKRHGRVADLDTVSERLKKGGATLILEAMTPGCPAYRVWITDDAERFQPRPDDWSSDRLYPEEDDLNFDHYLSEKSGCADLIPKWYTGQNVGDFLKRYFGDVEPEDCLFIWSGWIERR